MKTCVHLYDAIVSTWYGCTGRGFLAGAHFSNEFGGEVLGLFAGQLCPAKALLNPLAIKYFDKKRYWLPVSIHMNAIQQTKHWYSEGAWRCVPSRIGTRKYTKFPVNEISCSLRHVRRMIQPRTQNLLQNFPAPPPNISAVPSLLKTKSCKI